MTFDAAPSQGRPYRVYRSLAASVGARRLAPCRLTRAGGTPPPCCSSTTHPFSTLVVLSPRMAVGQAHGALAIVQRNPGSEQQQQRAALQRWEAQQEQGGGDAAADGSGPATPLVLLWNAGTRPAPASMTGMVKGQLGMEQHSLQEGAGRDRGRAAPDGVVAAVLPLGSRAAGGAAAAALAGGGYCSRGAGEAFGWLTRPRWRPCGARWWRRGTSGWWTMPALSWRTAACSEARYKLHGTRPRLRVTGTVLPADAKRRHQAPCRRRLRRAATPAEQ